MKNVRALLLLLLPLASACAGGNWSNRDLEILNALPERKDLESKLPERGTAQGGLGTRQDGLTLGEPSELYRQTHVASRSFNEGVEKLLGLVDAVRTLPPTDRDGSRIQWGPYPLKELGDVEGRVLMDQLSERQFRFAFDWRRQKEGAPWVTVLELTAVATDRFRKSHGTMVYDAKRTRAAALPTDPAYPLLEQILIDYDTASDPVTVELQWVQSNGSLTYRYAERGDRSGRLSFVWENVDLVPGLAREVVDVTAAWLPEGAGKAKSTVREGDGKGHGQTECWDLRFRLTYGQKTLEPGRDVGTPESCPTGLDGL